MYYKYIGCKKKIFLLSLSTVLLFSVTAPVQAVENGVDATGSPFVVPIKIQADASSVHTCSGALIAASIVVTAGHCVLDNNGLVTKLVYVGKAGSSMESVTTADLINTVQISSNFHTGISGLVGDDDLAFLTLSKPQPMQVPISLASEVQYTALKNSQGPLKLIGYGRYGATSTQNVTYPNSYEGSYSSVAPTGFPNSAYIQSSKANACVGDSGSPIISTTATSITVVGILTGVKLNGSCTEAFGGLYYGLFTLIGRYSNLAFASTVDQMNLLQNAKDEAESKIAALQSNVDSQVTQIAQLQYNLDEANSALQTAQETITQLQTQVAGLIALAPKALYCVKGKLTQKVVAVKPKCPAGYVVKK